MQAWISICYILHSDFGCQIMVLSGTIFPVVLSQQIPP
uniref:Uncharacterized protein n=1 Tax=Arundo donax TaxID=35708 RepID=A0A0A8ZDR4_ARUDO